MLGNRKKLRTSALVGAAGWLILLSLACGGSGDDDDESTSSETPAAEPAAPADPFDAASATMERLASELERLATSSPQAFQNQSSLDDRALSANPVRQAGDPTQITLRLRWTAGLGGNAERVYAVLHRFPDGRVRMADLRVQAARDGQAAYTAPPPIAAIAQTLRLRVLDGGCDLPVMSDAELREAFGSLDLLQRPAREAATNCPAVATAFGAARLSLAYVSISVRYRERPGFSALSSLNAQIDSNAELRYSHTEFTYQRR